MHTINKASYSQSGRCLWPRATSLMREGPDSPCPFPLIASDGVLEGMNWTTYLGWYHTDVTVPSEYFLSDQGRPQTIEFPIALDFSYLHAFSGRIRPVIPVDSGYPIRSNPATCSGALRPPS